MPDSAARGARRALWIFRGTFYTAAAVAAALVVDSRGGHSPEMPLVGTTAHGTQVSIELDGQSHAQRIDAQVMATCPHATWPASWVAIASGTPFRQDGRHLRVEQSWPVAFRYGRDAAVDMWTLDARVSDEHAEGVITFTRVVDAAYEPDYVCTSESVRFSVSR